MKAVNPTTIVIFGATGDLFRKKLSLALFNLFAAGLLPDFFRIVAFSRRHWSDDDFRKFFGDILREKFSGVAPVILKNFLERVLYIEGDLDLLPSFQKTAELLGKLDAEAGVCINKLFYLATPPSSYEGILNHISKSGLAIPCAPAKDNTETGWTRILIEKPFGSDLAAAKRIDGLLSELFSESQIFRVDHYLAKETLRHILAFRFSDGAFEKFWNGDYVEKITVRLFEKGGINGRGASYLGALRDVGQNHALQMAALVAMEDPGNFSAGAVRAKRGDILKKFKLATTDIFKSAVRAQYDGYQDETGVPPLSFAETYFKLKIKSASPRWRGAVFTVESGKCLPESKVEILVHFRKPVVFSLKDGGNGAADMVCFRIQPKEEILAFSGLKESYRFSFSSVGKDENNRKADAYEKVLLDAVKGDQTLFTSTDEIIAEWNIIMPILAAWSKIATAPPIYVKGTMPNI